MSRRRSLRAHSTSFNSCLPAVLLPERKQPDIATVARFPLKERPFHSVRRRRICSKIYGLVPAMHASYHSANGSQQPLKMQPLCLWFCAMIPSEPLKDNSGSHPCPTSCFLPGSLNCGSFNVTSQRCVPAQAPLVGLNTQHGCLTAVTE